MKKLKVYIELGGERVLAGRITGNDRNDAFFQYDRDFIERGLPISVSLPIQKEPFSPERTVNYFEGLLPEGFSRKSVARWLHLDEEDYLSILSGLGKECIGAVQILDEEEADPAGASYKRLSVEEVRKLAQEGATRSSEIVVQSHLSLTGASGKVGLYYDQSTDEWYQPLGTAPSTHIVKQSHVRLSEIVENEQLVLLTAAKAGIPTVSSFIVREAFSDANHTEKNLDGTGLLATARYDRDMKHSGRFIGNLKVPLRLHQEDFAQALGISSSQKYEPDGGSYLSRIFRLIRDYSQNPIEDGRHLLDMIIFDVLIGNTDNHIKNYSLLYSPDLKTVRLAPAYDLICTQIYKEGTSEMSVSIAGERIREKIDREVFSSASAQIGISKKLILKEYDRLREEIPAALRDAAKHLSEDGLENAESLCGRILDTCKLN